jgi:protocatechuate 3,4-dioxygenase beta subunit
MTDNDEVLNHSPKRRHVLKTMGAALVIAGVGVGSRKAADAEQCTVLSDPSLTQGPYFVDELLNRSDIRNDTTTNAVQPGLTMYLTVNVAQLSNCAMAPFTGAFVDIWHCNGLGVYSDVAQQSTTGRNFLRGYQTTDRHGNARFTTIYPGWYSGRTPHIHAKIRTFNGTTESYEFTTQFFMDDAVSDFVYTLSPYNQRPSRDTRNTNDGIFLGTSSLGNVTSNGGAELLLRLNADATRAVAFINLVLDLSLGSSPDQAGGEPGTPGGPPPGGGPPIGPPPGPPPA